MGLHCLYNIFLKHFGRRQKQINIFVLDASRVNKRGVDYLLPTNKVLVYLSISTLAE